MCVALPATCNNTTHSDVTRSINLTFVRSVGVRVQLMADAIWIKGKPDELLGSTNIHVRIESSFDYSAVMYHTHSLSPRPLTHSITHAIRIGFTSRTWFMDNYSPRLGSHSIRLSLARPSSLAMARCRTSSSGRVWYSLEVLARIPADAATQLNSFQLNSTQCIDQGTRRLRVRYQAAAAEPLVAAGILVRVHHAYAWLVVAQRLLQAHAAGHADCEVEQLL